MIRHVYNSLLAMSVGAIAFGLTYGCGHNNEAAQSAVSMSGGIGSLAWTVPSSIAGDKDLTFARLTSDVYDALISNDSLTVLNITVAVSCQDNYGKSMMRESVLRLDRNDIEEMRKFASAAALAEGCIEWQIVYEAGYMMCGQIE
jgi:hypothetical protein